jgi:prevent-host-death family protein
LNTICSGGYTRKQGFCSRTNNRLDAIGFDKLKKFVYDIFRLDEEAGFMPNIKSSTDLRNNYNEISTFCRESREPVFITKNGQGDLVVMSIETYEMLNGKLELYRLLDEGRAAVKEGRKRPLEDVMQDIRQEITDGKL